MLRFDRLVKAYEPGKPVLDGITLDITRPGIVAIIGPSGTGKSTLIRCVNRLTDPTGGRILLEGEDITTVRGSNLRRVRRRIGMVFQEYNLVERLSVIENVLSGRLGYMPFFKVLLRRYSDEDIARAFELLEAVGLDPAFANRRASQLSGGQRQRVGIARAIMQNPSLVLADEPTSSLDPRTSVEIMELMVEIGRKRDIPILINMHDVGLARRYADRIIGMDRGKVVFDGPPEDITADHLNRIYGGEGWQ
nr:phosphonate ABC transporter ATP-binding protein [Tropicimonas sp. IMCC34043]